MFMSRLVCLIMVSLCVAMATSQTYVVSPGTDPECNTLHAVYTYHGIHYYIYGDNFPFMTGVDENGQIVFEGTGYDTGFTFPITAAVGIPMYNGYYMYSGPAEEPFPHRVKGNHPLFYSGADAVLRNALGQYVFYVDAAYTAENSTVAYFSGCDYVIIDAKHFRVVESGKNEEIGLPCDVDAAWSTPSHKLGLISKGDQLYEWHAGEARVRNPVNLYSVLGFMKQFNLCPLSTR